MSAMKRCRVNDVTLKEKNPRVMTADISRLDLVSLFSHSIFSAAHDNEICLVSPTADDVATYFEIDGELEHIFHPIRLT